MNEEIFEYIRAKTNPPRDAYRGIALDHLLDTAYDTSDRNLKCTGVQGSECLLAEFEILEKKNLNVFLLEELLLNILLDVMGKYSFKAYDFLRRKSYLKLAFASEFMSDGVVVGELVISGEIYRQIADEYGELHGKLSDESVP